jgi:hypothetical protein
MEHVEGPGSLRKRRPDRFSMTVHPRTFRDIDIVAWLSVFFNLTALQLARLVSSGRK